MHQVGEVALHCALTDKDILALQIALEDCAAVFDHVEAQLAACITQSEKPLWPFVQLRNRLNRRSGNLAVGRGTQGLQNDVRARVCLGWRFGQKSRKRCQSM